MKGIVAGVLMTAYTACVVLILVGIVGLNAGLCPPPGKGELAEMKAVAECATRLVWGEAR